MLYHLFHPVGHQGAMNDVNQDFKQITQAYLFVGISSVFNELFAYYFV